MFLDGFQRKNGKRDQDSASSSTVLSTHQVFRQLNKRLSNGFACSPSRIIANVRTTRTSSSGSIIDINGGSNGKLSGPRSNCTALNDKITGKQSRAKQSESTKSAARLWSRGKSIEGQVKNVWVPSLKNSLHRSLSLQSGARPSINRKPPPHTGFNDKQGGGKRRQSAAAGKEDSLGKRQFSITGKRLKSVISSRVGKYDSLFGKYSLKAVTSFLGSVFILLANVSLLLDGSASLVEAASLPSAVVQPIWLRDGLISQLVSDDDLLSEPQQEVPQLDRLPGAIEQQQLNEQDQEPVVDFTQVPADGNDPADLRQAILGRTPWFKIEELKPVAPKEKDRDDKEHDGDELLWIERRRLERDRALEPPPWLREQPMRRNIAPTVEQQPGDNKPEPPIEIPIITSDSSSAQTSSVRHNRARQSRQLADQIYESFLKLLAEGSYGSSSFLDDLYAELELRNKANQRQQKSQTTINGGANPLYGNSAIQLQQQQSQNKQQDQQQEQQQLQSVSQMQSGGGQVQMDSQMQEPDSTLVVVGDEVSGGDDEATAMDGADASSTRQMSAAYTMQNDMNTSRDGPAGAQAATYLADPSGAGLAEMAQPKQAPLDAIAYGEVGSFVARPEGNGGAGGRLISSADLGMSSDQMQQQQPPASSFHVVEDIDQMDSSQDTGSNEHPSAQDTETSDMSPQEQQQQREQETANWSLQTEVNSQPFKSYHMKRSVAKFRMPGQQNFNELPDREFHTGKLYRPQDQLALTLIGSAKLSRGQLIGAAAKLKMHLEDMIGLPRATILGLYPMNSNQLLVKLDTSKLDPRYVANTLSKYDYARGFIVVTWPSSSQQNPMSLLSAISQALAQDEIEPVSTNVDASRGEYSILDAQAFKAPSPLSNLVNPYMLARPSSVETGAQFRPNNLELEAAELDDEDDETMAYPLMRSISGSKLGYLVQPSANSAPDRLSLAALARYLSAIYAAEQVGNPGYGISEQVDPSIVLAPKEAHRTDPNDNKGLYQPYMLHFLVLMVAILGAYLAVKLVMSSDGKRALRRRFGRNGSIRSLWSSSRYSADDDEDDHDAVGEVLNHQQTQGKQGADLQASNPRQLTKRHLSDDSGHVSAQEIGAKEQKTHPAGLDVLAQRLINLLSYHHYYQRHKNKPDIEDGECKKGSCEKESAGLAVDKKEELDEVSANDFEINTCSETATIGSNPGPQPYRSSHSYIKSLIDVLSKARAQFPSSQQHRHRSKTPLIADDTMDLSPGGELDSNCGGEVSLKLQQQQQQLEEEDAVAAGVLMSQMDISAAHLILAYMEKHLEDKERLRREWLELNGCSGGSNSSSGNKIVQLTLQKLAKVALSEANIGKNRNRSVVPFDRNRVRLASCSDAAATATSASQDQSGANNKPAGGGGGGGSGGLKLQQQQQTGDYINASYIYDDDLRRPTHIIAQGPTEQTSHQFWQMVWEQGISVIVMLTRLNENSKQMCHCYWPKNNSVEASATATGGAGQPAGSPSLAQVPSGPSGALGSGETTATQRAALWKDESTSTAVAALAANGASSPTTPANGRRVSVTSVFNTLAALQNGNGQPIIANGDLNNNMISFNVDYTSTSNDNDEHTDNDKENVSDDELQTSIGGKSTGAVPIGNKSKNSTTKAAAPQATATARFEVHLVSEHVSSSDYLVRNMYMINRSTGETRTITQFHYLAWPEAGVPDSVKSFLAFRRKVHKSYRNLKSPILVHCSDGGGRSGTYTLIDIILERIKKGAKEIDPRATLEHLRDQRVGLCGTQSQFEFVSVALAEEIQIILNALPQ